MRLRILQTLLLLIALTSPARPCATFVLRSGDQIVLGRNYDYYVGYDIVFQNHYQGSGDVSRAFEYYTRDTNRNLIYQTYRSLDWLKSVPDWTLDALASFPESFPCNRTHLMRRHR